ncbi:MAG TPA: OmpA family protein [Ottowia sp.]|uniref:OmpA family protein n=1 Tax=Ottowia sp. TaxID=1898956 RepID=UPI002C919949|nr:OmpA family protein [Ottowia sp.]HMN20614.1 OmpA family protein [Ottowia sp.]
MRPVLLLALAGTLLAGCAPATRVTLLPQEQARSALEVRSATSRLVLDQPYEQAEVRTDGAIDATQTSAERVQARYRELLAAQPPAARPFTLYFESGGTQFTPESQAALDTALEQARQRPGGEIVVIGHTDRVGTTEANDALSLRRAQATREMLIQRGFDARRIQAVGRGERDPAVATEDEVAEPRNRRTEIIVR